MSTGGAGEGTMETFEQRVARLKETAKEVRFRVVDMIHAAQSGLDLALVARSRCRFEDRIHGSQR